jgi:hypothetical protein
MVGIRLAGIARAMGLLLKEIGPRRGANEFNAEPLQPAFVILANPDTVMKRLGAFAGGG